MPDTHTPEGMPARCPHCGLEVSLELLQTNGEAICPQCGNLLWPSTSESSLQPQSITNLTRLQDKYPTLIDQTTFQMIALSLQGKPVNHIAEQLGVFDRHVKRKLELYRHLLESENDEKK